MKSQKIVGKLIIEFQADLFVVSLGCYFFGVWLATDSEYSDSEGNSLFNT